MNRRLMIVALALATTVSLGAQAPKSAVSARKKTAAAAAANVAKPSARHEASTRYVPAIMQQKMTTLSGCLQHGQDYTLTNAKISQQGDVAQATDAAPAAAGYKLEGISPARLSILVGKHVDVTGAFQEDPKAAATPRFEATAVQESAGSC